MFLHISWCLTIFYFIYIYLILMSQITRYFYIYSSTLIFYTDVVLTLSIEVFWYLPENIHIHRRYKTFYIQHILVIVTLYTVPAHLTMFRAVYFGSNMVWCFSYTSITLAAHNLKWHLRPLRPLVICDTSLYFLSGTAAHNGKALD